MIIAVTKPPPLPKNALVKVGKIKEYALRETNTQTLLSSVPH